MSLTKEEVIHEIFKNVMFAVGEVFEEQEEESFFDDEDDDDFIPEEKVTTDIFEEKILDAITLTIEELIENGEIHFD
jgi:hypothetical protein